VLDQNEKKSCVWLSLFYSDTFPLILEFYAAFFSRIYLYFLLIGHGLIPILSIMLATDSIDPPVKNVLFFTDSIDHRSPKKIFLQYNRTISLNFFFLQKTIDPIDVFMGNQLLVLIQSMFFSPSKPTYA
jgi:hypothetical protein